MAGEMGLVGKAGFERGTCQAVTGGNHPARLLQPPHQKVAVRAGAENLAELAGESEAIKAADGLEFLRADRAIEVGFEIVRRLKPPAWPTCRQPCLSCRHGGTSLLQCV